MNPVDRANKLVSGLIEAGWIENDMKALALIAVIAPVIRDAMLEAAEAGAREMQYTIADGPCRSDEDRPHILELDPAEVTRRIMDGEELR